jgi:hypothetical protein
MRIVLLSVAMTALGIVLLLVLAGVGTVLYYAGHPPQPERRRPAGAGGRGMPFDTESLEFARGVEFGLLFASVKDYGRAEMAVHADMAELVMRLAESRRLPFGGKPHEHDEHCSECTGRSDCKDGDDWLDVTVG